MQAPKLVANIVIVNALGQLLLVRRSKTAPVRVFDWELPGGIVEPAEDPKATAIRELQEETGLSIENAEYLFAGTEPSKAFTGLFFYANVESEIVKLSYEHDDYKWFNISDAINKVTVPGYKYALKYYKDYILKSCIVKVATKCIINKNGKTLLLKRSSSDSLGPGLWDLPGGGMEATETVFQSMSRELKEETNLNVKNLQLVFGHTHLESSNTIKIRLGLLASEVTGKVKISFEHSEYVWLPLGETYNFSKHDNWPGWSEFINLFG